jgi:hypothetical protein
MKGCTCSKLCDVFPYFLIYFSYVTLSVLVVESLF